MTMRWLATLLVSAVLIGMAPQAGAAITACSPYMGQVTLNELRVGSSGKSKKSNQVELYNPGGVSSAVWRTWQLVVYGGRSGRIKYREGYYLSSGFTENGAFIYNDNKSIYLVNRNSRYVDVALVDSTGALIDYVAVEGRTQGIPACFGGTTTVNATTSSKRVSGDIPRLPDGANWPANVTNTSGHSIGRSNVCTASGSDLAVSYAADITTPMVNTTTVTYTLNVTNNSCSNAVNGVVLSASNINATNFSGLSTTRTQGSVTIGAASLSWSVGNLAPGDSETLTVSGKPKTAGILGSTASVTSPGAGLVNTGDDSATETLTVRDYNYVGFDLSTDTITEGATASYSATISSNVEASKPITINYTVTGTATGADTDLSASGSVIIDPSDEDSPTSTNIDFDVLDDVIHEADKTIILSITSVVSADGDVRMDGSANELRLTLVDDDPAFVAPGGFNSFEPATAAGSVTGVIKTKVSGNPFSLDIVALNLLGTAVEGSFAGNVKVELVNAAAGANCAAYPVIQDLGSLELTLANLGRKTFADIIEANAWSNVRLRISHPVVAPTLVACSTDNFAIRPSGFTLVVTDGDWQSAGTNRTLNNALANGGVVHKAGQPFTLTVVAQPLSANQYTGSPTVKSLTCTLPAGCLGGNLSTGVFSGNGTRASAGASYSEVGTFALELQDTLFAAVDAADSNLAERTVPQVGGPLSVGRFVPDHFDVTYNTPAFATACGSFTYLGQPFDYATPPELTVTAKNSGGGVTANYTGALFKLTAATLTEQAYSAASGTLEAVAGSLPAPVVTELGGGQGKAVFSVGNAAAGGGLRFARGNAPTLPLDADIVLSVNVLDSEGVAYAGNPARFGQALAGQGIGFNGGKDLRFGRLRLANAFGSELLALPVPLTAQYWNGQGFITNSLDTCTTLAAPAFTFFNQTASNQLAAGETHASHTSPLAAGSAVLRLSAPGLGNHGYLDLSVAAPDWLRFNWDGVDQGGDGNLLDDLPRARAAFGLRNTSKVIIRREMY